MKCRNLLHVDYFNNGDFSSHILPFKEVQVLLNISQIKI